MSDYKPIIDDLSSTPKYLQLVESIENAVQSNMLNEGDALPSVNFLIKECALSRDTVFKAYSELKRRKIIESVPNKGYYVAVNSQKIFLFLDTFKAYKEVLYGAFRKALPLSYHVDVHFHHYNVDIFESILTNVSGKYSHYIVMNFDDKRVKKTIQRVDPGKLLCIDWIVNTPEKVSYIGQDFGKSVYDNLNKVKSDLLLYKKLYFVYPRTTYHPKDSIIYFEKFCSDNHLNYEILYDENTINPQEGDLYFLVSDRILALLLDKLEKLHYKTGKEVGIISYNETPMKKYIKNGITVISTDFEEMGTKMAGFIINENPIKEYVPTNIIKRSSL